MKPKPVIKESFSGSCFLITINIEGKLCKDINAAPVTNENLGPSIGMIYVVNKHVNPQPMYVTAEA